MNIIFVNMPLKNKESLNKMKKIIYFLSFIFLCTFPAKSKTLEQKLNVNIGIFDAAKVTMSYSLDDVSYAFSSNVETDGLFAKLYYFSALYSTTGKINDNQFITQNYSYTSKSSSHIRTKQLVFDKLGTLLERISSKDKKDKKVKINLNGKLFDFNDLQTVFAYLAQQIKNDSVCSMEKEVFDGKKSYQITVKDKGFSTIDEKDISYKGDAKKCSIFIKRLDVDDDDLLFSNTADRPIYFWIAKEKETLMPFVVKIEIDSTPLGKLKAYTTEVNIKE